MSPSPKSRSPWSTSESKERIEALLASFRCDLDRTYFDVPRMRTSTSDDYLTSDISYAFIAHRDT
jgi:hypothetical protein